MAWNLQKQKRYHEMMEFKSHLEMIEHTLRDVVVWGGEQLWSKIAVFAGGDRELALESINRFGGRYSSLDWQSKLFEDPVFAMRLCQVAPSYFFRLSYELQEDKEIGLAVVRLNGTLFKMFGEKLQDDEDVFLAAVQCICEIRRADGWGHIDVVGEILDMSLRASVRLQGDKPFMSRTLDFVKNFFLHT